MKSMNWISATGWSPYRAMPIAIPMIPSSESGVSITLSGPNSSNNPSVALKTPPFLPTSSPRITIFPFRRISSRSAPLTACTMLSRTIEVLTPFPSQLIGLFLQVPGQLRVHVREHGQGRRLRYLFAVLDDRDDFILHLLLYVPVFLFGHQPLLGQVNPESLNRVTVLPELDLLRASVPAGVVGGRMPTDSVCDG